MKSKNKRKTNAKVIKSEDVPVTVKHLNSMKNEILCTVNERFSGQDAKFLSIDQRFEAMDRRFEQVDRRFVQMDQRIDQRFEQMELQFKQFGDKMDRRFARLEVLICEQNSRNVFVLDGYNNLSARLDKVEKKLKDFPV